MPSTWITNASTNVEAMVNSINAACDEGFVPDRISILENPDVEEPVRQAVDHAETIVEAYGGEAPDVQLTSLAEETEFDRLRAHHQAAIEDAADRGDEVAVDITPGRKYMSAIAFATGMRYGADHVYYFYLSSADFHGRLYPEIPRTAVNLYDFTEDAR